MTSQAGHNHLQGRSVYQPIIVSQDGRYIAYVVHHASLHPPMNPLTHPERRLAAVLRPEGGCIL